MLVHKQGKRKVKRIISQSKKKVNEQFGKIMNQDVREKRKRFWSDLM